MTRKGRAITISLKEPDKIALQTIATQLGYTWGDNPNISKLVEAIAQQKLLIAPNHDWSAELIATLHKAMLCLHERGNSSNAQTIAELLLKRSELKNPLRKEIERFLESLQKPNWRKRLDEFIDQSQPFQLAYQDAAQRIWTFHIQHAEICPRSHEYLDCWCQENSGNTDLPKLQHNWTLRLDRITDAALSPIDKKWRPDLDRLRVELHLYNGLAFAYEPKTNDIYTDWVPDLPQTKKVIREVSSTFWLFREILPYGEDCAIASPPEVRDRFRDKLLMLCNRYDDTAH
ncbi:MAG: WYL domain-containing protein [Acaryochloridaceae cyanobacterium RU_4_10]|nr:WYL domain-containing protein [Acaryochloridaceae cyanobacterium RU_4_10]